MILKILEWIIYSSKDPNKLSLTISGAVSTIVVVAGIFGVQATGLDFGPMIDSIVKGFGALGELISYSIMIYGFGRKLWTTFTGQNKVIRGY